VKRELFAETSHSPSLVDLVGHEAAANIIDFCFIANPYYPTVSMVRDLQRRLPALIKAYPSSNPRQAQQHLAEVLHVDPDWLVIGNGASELIALMEENLISRIAIPVPTFGEYLDKLHDGRQARLYTLSANDGYQLDLGHYATWIAHHRVSSALVINPGNPTGQFHPLEDMLAFLDRMRALDLVVVDESFIDFCGDPVPSLLAHLAEFGNLLVVRSMSKHCGVPGLRLGYCCTSNASVLSRLRHVLPVWNVNSIAEYFISMLPATDRQYHRARRRLIADVKWLHGQLEAIDGYTVYPTGSNFVLVRIDLAMTSQELQAELLERHGCYVRDCANKVAMDTSHIRVASQGKVRDAVLVDALTAISAISANSAGRRPGTVS
jgi:threonine-phosphate decarboxylase